MNCELCKEQNKKELIPFWKLNLCWGCIAKVNNELYKSPNVAKLLLLGANKEKKEIEKSLLFKLYKIVFNRGD